jgi:hypothetical protein
MSDQGRDETPITIRMLERFYHKSGESVAVSLAINEDIVFLPLDHITIEDTGLISNERRIINITMPTWLAQDKRLA